MADTAVGEANPAATLAAQQGPAEQGPAQQTAGGNGAWACWYPALVGALAGAMLAVVICEARLEAALRMRPPILVADYGPFLTALEQGAKPDALKVLAEHYTSRGGELGRRGVLVLNREWVVGSPGWLALPQDRQVLDLMLGLAAPGLPSPGGGVPAPLPGAAVPAPGGPGSGTAGHDEGISPGVAAALAGAIRQARPR
jgi:hypothetical protein